MTVTDPRTRTVPHRHNTSPKEGHQGISTSPEPGLRLGPSTRVWVRGRIRVRWSPSIRPLWVFWSTRGVSPGPTSTPTRRLRRPRLGSVPALPVERHVGPGAMWSGPAGVGEDWEGTTGDRVVRTDTPVATLPFPDPGRPSLGGVGVPSGPSSDPVSWVLTYQGKRGPDTPVSSSDARRPRREWDPRSRVTQNKGHLYFPSLPHPYGTVGLRVGVPTSFCTPRHRSTVYPVPSKYGCPRRSGSCLGLTPTRR